MEKFFARFKPYRKNSKEGSSSSTPRSQTPTARAAGQNTNRVPSSGSAHGKREHTVGDSRNRNSVLLSSEKKSASTTTAAPRIDLDFKIPGEQVAAELPTDAAEEENTLTGKGHAKDLSSVERKAVNETRFTPDQAANAWRVSGKDLLSIGFKERKLFTTPYDGVERHHRDSYRLAAIFAVSSNPSSLPSYPSLSDYFPPPAFVPDNHDWLSDYTSYSGYTRDPRVLVHFLRWVTKRVQLPSQGSVDAQGLPQWYTQFVKQEQSQEYPENAFRTILSDLIPVAYGRYLEALFDCLASICANEANNDAGLDWMCDILGVWVIGASKKDDSNDDVHIEGLETGWRSASTAMHHLFRCWVRSQLTGPAGGQLPLLIRDLVAGYRGPTFERHTSQQETTLWLQVKNEIEDTQAIDERLTRDQLGVGLIREAKYGSSVSLADWIEAGQTEEAVSASPSSSTKALFDLLSRSVTSTGERLSDFDPAVIPLPLSPSSTIDTKSIYRPFRKASTSSFFSDLSTPYQPSRTNSWLPASEPAKPKAGVSNFSSAESSNSRLVAGMNATTISVNQPGSADWKSFTKSGFGGDSQPAGLTLGDPFEETKQNQSLVRHDSGSPFLMQKGKEQPSPLLSPQTPGTINRSSRTQAVTTTGVFLIQDLTVRKIEIALLDFLQDLEFDSPPNSSTSWPTVLVLNSSSDIQREFHLQGHWIVIVGHKARLPKAVVKPKDVQVEQLPIADQRHVSPAPSQYEPSLATSKRVKSSRRTSIFGMLSLSRPKVSSSASSYNNSSQVSRAPSINQSEAVSEMGQLKSPLQDSQPGGSARPNQRPRAASNLSVRKQVPGMLDDVAVISSTSLDPNGTGVVNNVDQGKEQLLASPVAITGSDSRGNLVHVQQDDDAPRRAVPEALFMPDQSMTDVPRTPTSALRPDTAETDTDISATPRRGRRSAAPSPDSALAERSSTRSVTPEPSATNLGQPSGLPDGVGELKLSEGRPSGPSALSSPPRAESLVSLGAPVFLQSSSPRKIGFPDIAALSVIEEEAGHIRTPPSFLRALVAGAVAGLSVDLMFYPIDTIKTRLQSQQGFVKAGGFKGIYKGVGSVGVGSAPGAAAFFTAYENLKQNLPKQSTFFNANPALTHMFAASGGEFMACLIRVPTEIVKSRTQTSAYGAGTSSLSSATNVLKYEGFRGFYRGFGITLAREIPFTAIQFPLYEALKTKLSQDYLAGKRKPLAHEAAVCGMIAGGVAAALTTPLDVVKTRAMLEAKATKADGASRRAASVLSIPSRLAQITSQEGVKALFAGVVPRTMWISLGGAVFLGAYDLVSDPFQMKM